MPFRSRKPGPKKSHPHDSASSKSINNKRKVVEDLSMAGSSSSVVSRDSFNAVKESLSRVKHTWSISASHCLYSLYLLLFASMLIVLNSRINPYIKELNKNFRATMNYCEVDFSLRKAATSSSGELHLPRRDGFAVCAQNVHQADERHHAERRRRSQQDTPVLHFPPLAEHGRRRRPQKHHLRRKDQLHLACSQLAQHHSGPLADQLLRASALQEQHACLRLRAAQLDGGRRADQHRHHGCLLQGGPRRDSQHRTSST